MRNATQLLDLPGENEIVRGWSRWIAATVQLRDGGNTPGSRLHLQVRTNVSGLQHVREVRPGQHPRTRRMALKASSRSETSRYVSGTSRNWLKTKCFAESELILIGTEIGKDGKPVALLARHAEGRLAFAGGALIALPKLDGDPALDRDIGFAAGLCSNPAGISSPSSNREE